MSTAMLPTAPPAQGRLRRGEPAWEVALLFPVQGEWTEAEYLALNASRLVELSEGCLEVHPMATLLHQLIVALLYDLLKAHVAARAAGVVVFAPLPVRLGPVDYREPDIIYLKPDRIGNLRGYPNGADLVMEVVSEGEESRERDLQIKRRVYAEARISEYWIVDPQEQRITVLTLDGPTYREHGIFGPGAQATSVLFPEFTVGVDAVFSVGLPIQ